jgi:hypothetical protein
MIPSSLPPTTHTLEMAQVAELNQHLTDRPPSPAITADAIGMTGAPLDPADDRDLAEDDVLVRVSWQGSPEFPDIHGHFSTGRGGPPERALLHTAALHELSRLLGLRQRWGFAPMSGRRPG